MPEQYKIAIVGAASLRGKELNEALAESPFSGADFLLMDDEEQLGQLESVGDEVAFIQTIEPGSFQGVDFVFFAGSEEITRRHWKNAQRAGASIIDLTSSLEGEPGVLVCGPWVQTEMDSAPGQALPGLETPAVVSAHPASVILALLLLRMQELGKIRAASATILEPASQYGRAAMDELHQQTISLLNFQSLPKAVYDAQVAFNLLPVFGEAAKISLAGSEARIRRHYELLSSGQLPEVAVQLIQAPVFHGYGISLAVRLDQPVIPEHVEAALGGEHVDVLPGDSDPPTNLSTAGQPDILVRIRTQDGAETESDSFWIWAAADNLKLTALNALACALELRKLRPQGKVQ
ncbi:Asd/ArgC dimerization domain-containing protein [Paracidobacterium acidisoli]|uniref:Segregation protein B n=1 Tax=Paracidobacterium acidisoli TaxID=2303751 RepID=A0A372ITB6_9BACT|nr:Asd/ArgC dimerization domain-containing protein [Paracidobacterium acidisoli]MBT9329423.1 segregation protein B [Paracidobacterium acidisoli]